MEKRNTEKENYLLKKKLLKAYENLMDSFKELTCREENADLRKADRRVQKTKILLNEAKDILEPDTYQEIYDFAETVKNLYREMLSKRWKGIFDIRFYS